MGRRTWASDQERENYQTDAIGSLDTRVSDLEGAPDGPGPQVIEQAGIVRNGLGSTDTDITETATVTVTVDSVAHIVGFMDVQTTSAAGLEVIGELVKSGVKEPGQIIGSARQISRWTPGLGWIIPLAPGVHTFKLVARKEAASGTVNIQGQTRLTGIILPT